MEGRHRAWAASILSVLLLGAVAMVGLCHGGEKCMGRVSLAEEDVQEGGSEAGQLKSLLDKFRNFKNEEDSLREQTDSLTHWLEQRAKQDAALLTKIKGWVGALLTSEVKIASGGKGVSGGKSLETEEDTASSVPAHDDSTQWEPERKTSSAEALWGYKGQLGPLHWGQLSSDYSLCATGALQSPIDIGSEGVKEEALSSIGWTMPAHTEGMVRARAIPATEQLTKLALVADLNDGPTMVVGSKVYTLEEIHFHTPAEHVVGGVRADGEAQFVHYTADADRKKMIVSVLFDGKEDGARKGGELGKLMKGRERGGVHSIDLNALSHEVLVGSLPSDTSSLVRFEPNFGSYYQYEGSVTVPPCTEGVTWLVLKHHVTVDAEELAELIKVQGHNSRPVQPLNGRTILEAK